MTLLNVINLNQLKSSVDIDLIIILVSALAVGVAIQKSGTSSFLVNQITSVFTELSPILAICILFFLTLGLTSLITNAAAVSIMFPVAYEMGLGYGGSLTPFFIAIAFAASADFMTPIGYQTNLMVLGPGNYKFSDYTKLGFPLTLIYSTIVLFFINFYYL
jgi:di/tricarboxylate transporter